MKLAKAFFLLFSLMLKPIYAMAFSFRIIGNEQFEKRLRSLQKKSMLPGLQVRVIENNEVIFHYFGGVRVIGFSTSIGSNDLWHLGSGTKPMTAFLIGRLVDKKLLRWDTSIGEIAPKGYALDPLVKSITVEQLLSHSSGLIEVTEPDDGKLWPTLFDEEISVHEQREKLVRAILSSPGHFAPGSNSAYSNSGYVILGWMIEVITSTKWENYVQNELFKKLNMNSCGFGPAGTENKNFPVQPWPHVLEGKRLKYLVPGIKADNPPAIGPAGVVHCSAKDWQRFLDLLLRQERGEATFLSDSSFRKLSTNTGFDAFTFGSFGRDKQSWANGTVFIVAGTNTMNYALAAVAPKTKRIITINTNAAHANAEKAASEILELATRLKKNISKPIEE